MTYTKKTWATGETVEASELNNIETGLDDIHNQDCSIEGLKTFNKGVLFVKSTTHGGRIGMQFDKGDDTNWYSYILADWSSEGIPTIRFYSIGIGAQTKNLQDIYTHDHDGGNQGAKVKHTNLEDVFADQHHAKNHGSRHDQDGGDPLTVGVPSDIGASNQEGSGNEFVRIDHVHKHPSGLGTDLHHNQNHGHDPDHTDRDSLDGFVFTPANMVKRDYDGLNPEIITTPSGWDTNNLFPYMSLDPSDTGPRIGAHFTTPTGYKDGQTGNIKVFAQLYLSGGTTGTKVRIDSDLSETKDGSGTLQGQSRSTTIDVTAVNVRRIVEFDFDFTRQSTDFHTIFHVDVQRVTPVSNDYDGNVRLEAIIVEFTRDH